MIDSHCHLADEVFAGDLEAVVERAKTRGSRARVRDSRGGQRRRSGAGTARSRRSGRRCASRSACTRTTRSSYADEPGAGGDRSSAIRWRSTPSARAIGEIGLDYHYDFSPPRGAAGGLSRPGAAGARARAAGRDPHARGRRGHDRHPDGGGWRGGARRAALLHRRRGAGAGGARPRLLYFRRRHRDVPQGGGAAEHGASTSRSIDC